MLQHCSTPILSMRRCKTNLNIGLRRFRTRTQTSNLRKAHVTRDSINPATWVISVQRTIT